MGLEILPECELLGEAEIGGNLLDGHGGVTKHGLGGIAGDGGYELRRGVAGVLADKTGKVSRGHVHFGSIKLHAALTTEVHVEGENKLRNDGATLGLRGLAAAATEEEEVAYYLEEGVLLKEGERGLAEVALHIVCHGFDAVGESIKFGCTADEEVHLLGCELQEGIVEDTEIDHSADDVFEQRDDGTEGHGYFDGAKIVGLADGTDGDDGRHDEQCARDESAQRIAVLYLLAACGTDTPPGAGLEDDVHRRGMGFKVKG